MIVESKMAESPCVKLCKLNAADICTGCGRTRAEIGGWSTMSDAQQRKTLDAAAARLTALERLAGGCAPKAGGVRTE
jgi:uncharacterized protein